VRMLKMSGRGLGFSGGTVDKLESIPGFRTDLALDEALSQVETAGAALIGQTPDLVPADKKLYALRDVTATVDSVPLIAASIMSKKLAGGAGHVLLDVKVGQGAFMKTLERARDLARTMVKIGRGAGITTVAALTAMDEPLGFTVGNALEVREACAVLTRNDPVDARFRELCLTLAGRALIMAGKASDLAAGVALAESVLDSGSAAEKFAEIIAAQGGDPAVVRDPERLRVSRTVKRVRSDSEGFVRGIDAEAVGELGVWLGGGREQKEDQIDHSVGITLARKTGDSVTVGDFLADLYLRDESQAGDAAKWVRQAFTIESESAPPRPILYEFIEE